LRLEKAVFTAGLSVLLFLGAAGILFAQDEESFVRESSISKRDAVLLSVLFPGLGQMTAGHNLKGMSLFIGGASALAVFVNANENYTTKLSTYNRDKVILDGMALRGRANYTDADKLFRDIKNQADKLDNLNTTRNLAIWLAAGVYAYNLFDAIFLTSTSVESKKAELPSKITVTSTTIDRTPGIMITKRF